MSRLATVWRHHPWLTGVFAIAVLATLFFAVRSFAFMIYWSDPAHHNSPIEGWMTPRYVAHSWNLSPAVMQLALGPEIMDSRRRPLADIARDLGISLEELSARITAASIQLDGSQ